MESEDEVDIESDFNIASSLGVDVFSDINEPPSKLAPLQPDIVQHPWTLEQDWYLEQCADDKSRIVIEKMMLEEQYHVNSGRNLKRETFIPNNPTGSVVFGSEDAKPSTSRRSWTEEERSMFLRGVEIFGRKWSKIAELLPNRTPLQVKHYGYSYFRKKGQQEEGKSGNDDQMPPNNIATTMQDLVSNVTTAQPTTKNAKTKIKTKGKKSTTAARNSEGSSQGASEQTSGASSRFNHLDKFPDSELIRLNKEVSSDSEEVDVDIEDGSEGADYVDMTSAGDSHGDSVGALRLPSGDHAPLRPHSDRDGPLKLNTTAFPPSSDADHASLLNRVTCASSQDSAKGESVCLQKSGLFINSYREECTARAYMDSGAKAVKTETKPDRCVSELDDSSCENRDEKEYSHTTGEENWDGEKNVQEIPNAFQIQGSDGKMFLLPNPTQEMSLNTSEIQDQEMKIFCEFFDGRPGIKTAERYTKIRNHILEAWHACKPNYLYKTLLRNGLKKCGDVNIIGRIHAYLEQIGGINFGCEEAQYNRKGRTQRKSNQKRINGSGDITQTKASAIKETVNQRKRKVRDMFGIWVDERDMEGKTIDHEKEVESIVKKEPPKVKRRKAIPGYDPFKLMPCQHFSSLVPAPFDVTIDVSAMVLMDTHAHLCKTEVIGLLGGRYDVKRSLLQIVRVEPCDSISTGMQCEMDAVSQTEASERLRSHGLIVVGWYHSHPTFPPNPSVRDIETQQTFQEWFSLGKMPFVGIIINPYTTELSIMASDIRCLIITKQRNTNPDEVGTPYQFLYRLVHHGSEMDTLARRLTELVQKYAADSNKIEMFSKLNQQSSLRCIDKLTNSLEVHLQIVKREDREKLISALRIVAEKLYINSCDIKNCIVTPNEPVIDECR